MQIKFVEKVKTTYNEIGQKNPIRFQIYKKIAEDEYHSVSNKFRCKDFFNDMVVAHKADKEFSIYGFQVGPSMYNKDDKEGVPVVIYNLVPDYETKFQFVNGYMALAGLPKMELEFFDDKSAFVYIPWEYFENTYYISALSLLMRAVNVKDEVFFDLSAMVEWYKKNDTEDFSRLSALLKKGMDLGDKKKYIWYYSKDRCFPGYEGPLYQLSSLTHNCGLMSWGLDK